jgi:hypothetical protein
MRKDVKIAVISASVVAVGIVAYYGFRKNGWFRKKSGKNKDSDIKMPNQTIPTVNTQSTNWAAPITNVAANTLPKCTFPIRFGSKCNEVKVLQKSFINKGLGNLKVVVSGRETTLNNSGGDDGVLGNTTFAVIAKILNLNSVPTQLDKTTFDRALLWTAIPTAAWGTTLDTWGWGSGTSSSSSGGCKTNSDCPSGCSCQSYDATDISKKKCFKSTGALC